MLSFYAYVIFGENNVYNFEKKQHITIKKE